MEGDGDGVLLGVADVPTGVEARSQLDPEHQLCTVLHCTTLY